MQLNALDMSVPDSLLADIGFKSGRVEYDSGFLRLRGSFAVNGTVSEEHPVDYLFSLMFDVDLVYSVKDFDTENMSEEELDEMLSAFEHRNVPLNAWPYAREFASSMSVRMGFPALVLPAYKVIR